MGTWAIKEYRKFKDFEDEVSEVAYDAFLKGFVEYKGKVTKAFPNLDLESIMAEEPEQQEEEEEEVEVEAIEEAPIIVIEAKIEAMATKKTYVGKASRPAKDAAATKTKRATFVQEPIAKVIAKMKAIINAAIEAIKASSTLVVGPEK